LSPESSLFIGKRSQNHVSNYYLGDPISDAEVAAVQEAAENLQVDVLNTRFALIYMNSLRVSEMFNEASRRMGPATSLFL
jgi:hypothetical protein